MLIYFEKAFVTISWKFILETLVNLDQLKKMDRNFLQWHKTMCFA